MEKLTIEANLSIEKSGGAELLTKVIEKVQEALKEAYPEAEITVRKGFFQTIDGVWASDPQIESRVRSIIEEIRRQVVRA